MKMRQRRKLSRPRRRSWFGGVASLLELAGGFSNLSKSLDLFAAFAFPAKAFEDAAKAIELAAANIGINIRPMFVHEQAASTKEDAY